MSKDVREYIIKQLATGEFISGQAIGEHLGISRAAVSKHIKAITNMGLDIFRISGKGYRLPYPLQLLSKKEIEDRLSRHVPIEVYNLIDSTNTYLLSKVKEGLTPGQTVVAEFQSAGRGRRGKQWVSPFGSHIYLSMYWPLEKGMQAAMGLSLVVGLAICDALKELYELEAEVKWPNDIYLKGKKIAGILVELEGHSYETSHAVIGVGLNVQMPQHVAGNIDQPWTDIASQQIEGCDRNELVSNLIKSLIHRLKIHTESGLDSMLNEWQQKDYFYGKVVSVIAGDNTRYGISRGVNQQGALLLEIDGKVEPIYGGEISLRPA